MGCKPADDAPQYVWDAFNAQHPERKGKVPKPGRPYLPFTGPIHISCKR